MYFLLNQPNQSSKLAECGVPMEAERERENVFDSHIT
jgi:hypothetical protein